MIGPDNRKPIPVTYAIAPVTLVFTLVVIGGLLLEAIVIDEIRKLFKRRP